MYRTYNARYNGTNWTYVKPSTPLAYATVQNPDGSLHFLSVVGSAIPSWTKWNGSGNNNVFNAVDFGLSTSDPSGGVDNVSALTTAIAVASAAGGGTIFIPSGTYPLNGTINISTAMMDLAGIIIAGMAGSTKLVQYGGVPTFSITDWTSGSFGRGFRFQDLILDTNQMPVTTVEAYMIYVTASQNVTCSRVFFANCPAAMYLDNNALQCGLFDCTIEYDEGPSDATMITLGGSENYVVNGVIRQGGSQTGCFGVQVSPRGGGAYLTNLNISEFDTGIAVTGSSANLLHAFISNVHCEANVNAVTIQPAAATPNINQVFFSNCDFARTSDSSYVDAGVLISLPNGGTISDVFFNNCMSHDWAGPGIQVDAGQDIVINGGRYGMNATASSMTTSGAIAITGAATRVSIVGADCSGVIPSYHSQPPADGPQPHGISVTGAVTDMAVRGCNLTNNPSGALYVPTANTDLRATDCAGYNDQATPLVNGLPPLNEFSNISLSYYGPIAFYVWGTGVSSVKINGVVTSLTSGGFTLSQGEAALINYSGSPSCLVVGK